MSVSHIMLEANKKYILVSILLHGKVIVNNFFKAVIFNGHFNLHAQTGLSFKKSSISLETLWLDFWMDGRGRKLFRIEARNRFWLKITDKNHWSCFHRLACKFCPPLSLSSHQSIYPGCLLQHFSFSVIHRSEFLLDKNDVKLLQISLVATRLLHVINPSISSFTCKHWSVMVAQINQFIHDES